MPYTITHVHILRAPAERVWRALTQPAAICKWNPPDGFICEVHELDLRPGGHFRMSFISLNSGLRNTFGGAYREVVPNERLVVTDRFEDGPHPGEMLLTYRLRPVMVGTELTVEQAGLADEIPPEAVRLGWQQSFALLTRLVEAQTPAG